MQHWLFEAPLGCPGCAHEAEGDPMAARPRTPRRRSSFTAAQVRGEFRAAQRLGREGAPPATTIRTGRSERARHKDQLKGVERHHAFPQYLGGLRRQMLVRLPKDLHYLYHQEVDRILQLPRARSGAYRQMSRAERVALLRRLADHARSFDARYGTAILGHMRNAVRDAIAQGVL